MNQRAAGYTDFKEKVRAATDVVELVGQYLKLRRSGSNWQGLCPFHHERSPSFNVNRERQNYYCFGCHKGGDVFSFIMEQEGLEFKEALVFLAKRAGIPVENSFAGGRGRERLDLFYRINESTAEFYQKLLLSPQGEVAREYLSRRGITRESAERFQLGFAPQSWRQLYEHLSAQDFPPEKCETVGLIRRKSSGPGYYDTFRNRLIFPVRSVPGRVLGFGARVLDDSLPKYINSADSPVYTKKAILYGLDRAWRTIRKSRRGILVEGYFDVISLHQEGIEEAVAACGTAYSADQAKLLSVYADTVCIVTDGDAAGQKASVRAAGIQITVGGRPKVAPLDSGEDPDTIVRRDGGAVFAKRLAAAPGYFEFMRALVRERGDRPVEKVRAIRRILEDLTAFADGDLHLEGLLEELSTAFGTEIRVLRGELKKVRKLPGKRRKELGARDAEKADAETDADADDESGMERGEKFLLGILLSDTGERDALLGILSAEDFGDALHGRIFSVLSELGRPPRPEELGKLFPDPAAGAVVNELTFLDPPRSDTANWARASALRIKLKRYLELNRDFQGRVQALELSGEPVQPDLMAEWRHVGESIRRLRAEIDAVLAKQKGTQSL